MKKLAVEDFTVNKFFSAQMVVYWATKCENGPKIYLTDDAMFRPSINGDTTLPAVPTMVEAVESINKVLNYELEIQSEISGLWSRNDSTYGAISTEDDGTFTVIYKSIRYTGFETFKKAKMFLSEIVVIRELLEKT